MKLREYDNTGDFQTGKFYALEVPFFAESKKLWPRPVGDGWIVNPCAVDKEYVYVDIVAEQRVLFECSVNKAHVTGAGERHKSHADLYGGEVVSDVIFDNGGTDVIVNERLAEQLGRASLSGYRIEAVAIAVNQSKWTTPELRRVEFRGQECLRSNKQNVPENNSCPFCGHRPIVCPGCGHWELKCPTCDRKIIVSAEEHKGPTDPRWIIEGPTLEKLIVEGRNWDGADFIRGWNRGIVTRRVIDWLLKIDAKPFAAFPVRVDVTGMSERQMEQLTRASTVNMDDLLQRN